MTKIFRNSPWDVLCVLVIPFQATFFVVLAQSYAALSPLALVLLAPLLYALSMQNQGANHNHFHTPIFNSRWLNTLARMGFSFSGGPKTPHNAYHGYHHSTEKSWNELDYFEIIGLRRPLYKQVLAFAAYVVESFGLKYVLLMVLLKRWPLDRVAAIAAPRDPVLAEKLLRRITEPAALRATQLDVAAWVGFRLMLCAIDWQFFFFYFLPVSYVVETFRLGEDFQHHWGAVDPSDPRRDAVSCYGRLYNMLTFNLGYHQEHHLKPSAHWLKLSEVTHELPSDRRIVPFTHYFNLPIFHPAFAADLARRSAKQGPDRDARSA